MRLLIISDIHANVAALEAVLADAGDEWEKIWCLGDVIGYGPDPNECVSLLRQQEHISLSGNHDWAVLGKIDINDFNKDARMAIQWAQGALSEESRDFLDALPPLLQEDPFTLAHGSPRQPVWEYILEQSTAAVNFPLFETPYCLVGHTHVPAMFEQIGHGRAVARHPVYNERIALDDRRLILNPGSVGQPRDADPRAAYALLDTELLEWEYRRVDYPVGQTQERMRQAGLPARLINRIGYGL